jgi:hypothetical protein
MQIALFLKDILEIQRYTFPLSYVEWWDSYEGFILNCVKRIGGGVVEVHGRSQGVTIPDAVEIQF